MTILIEFTWLLLSTVAGFTSLRVATVPAVDPIVQADTCVQLASLHDGTFVGGTYDAYYGVVRVQATIKGGAIVDSTVLKFCIFARCVEKGRQLTPCAILGY